MYRRILSWALIVLGSVFLVLSVIGIGAIWIYRGPLTDKTVAKLQEVDTLLVQAKTALDNGQSQLQLTLRIVDAADKSLSAMQDQMTTAKSLSDQINGTLNDKLIPGLKTTRDKVGQLRGTLQGLRDSLGKLNSVPFLNLNLPGDQFLADIISNLDSIDKEIAGVQQLAQKASTAVGDTSYLLGGNLSDTKIKLQNLLDTVTEYDKQVVVWHAQVQGLIVSVPSWFTEAAVVFTLFLLWFGFSQFGLVLHGLALRQGADPLAPLRQLRSPKDYDASVD
jgi:hypothetical protein